MKKTPISLLPLTEEELHERARKASHVTRTHTARGQNADYDFGDALREACDSLIKDNRDGERLIMPLLDKNESEYFFRVKRHEGKLTFEKIEYAIDLGAVDDFTHAQAAVA